MKVQEFIKDYLSFTRKERMGIITLLVIIIIIFILPKLFSPPGNQEFINSDSGWISAIQKLEQNQNHDEISDHSVRINDNPVLQYENTNSNSNKSKGKLFYFDPNTLSAEGWQQLGLRDKTIQTIQNYLHKGGHFKKTEDLQKIYGLHQNEYERIKPFVRIESKPVITTVNNEKITVKNNEAFKNLSNAHYNIIEINSADTTAFISLPGIGSKLAARIINFRDKLGGFYSIDQIGETYGLPDSTFQKIKPFLKTTEVVLRKININVATKDELKSHPYIRWNIANAIVEYRNQHGNFQSLEHLKKIALINDNVFRKIAPYLSM